MFDVIPVVNGSDSNKDGHKFRKWLDKINSGKDTYSDKNYVIKLARLEQLEESLRNSVMSINGKFVFVGYLLQTVKDDCLYSTVYYSDDKYCDDIYKYAFRRFGLKKTTTHNLVSISEEFADLGELKKEWKSYTFSQLVELLSMSDADRSKVKPSMTIKQIRELKNSLALQAAENSDVGMSEEEIDYEVSDEINAEDCRAINPDVKIKYNEQMYFVDCSKLKNVAERKAFIEDYKKWGVWFEVPELQLVYYRYGLPNGDVLIVSEYKIAPDYYCKKERTVERYHLIDSEHRFEPMGNGTTILIDYLTKNKNSLNQNQKPVETEGAENDESSEEC